MLVDSTRVQISQTPSNTGIRLSSSTRRYSKTNFGQGRSSRILERGSLAYVPQPESFFNVLEGICKNKWKHILLHVEFVITIIKMKPVRGSLCRG